MADNWSQKSSLINYCVKTYSIKIILFHTLKSRKHLNGLISTWSKFSLWCQSYVFSLGFRFVGRFMSRRERLDVLGDKMKKFTNVYIKNFPASVDDERLREIFSKYGTIVSAKVMTSEDGSVRGFGFVSFEDHEAAAKVRDIQFVHYSLFTYTILLTFQLNKFCLFNRRRRHVKPRLRRKGNSSHDILTA